MTARRSQDNSPPPDGLNVNKLGYFLDGWSDLVEGMGTKADQVRKDVLEQLKGRQMPKINLGDRVGYVNVIGGERRDYVVADTDPAATTTIYIAEHGRDLYASWRTYIKPKFNDNIIPFVFGIPAVIGVFLGGLEQFGGPYDDSQVSFSFSGWLTVTIILIILAVGLLMVAGRVLRGSAWAFFIIQPNVFDAEDITAMSLSAHKSIIRALDMAGIDVSKLRLKQTFKGGRRGEEV